MGKTEEVKVRWRRNDNRKNHRGKSGTIKNDIEDYERDLEAIASEIFSSPVPNSRGPVRSKKQGSAPFKKPHKETNWRLAAGLTTAKVKQTTSPSFQSFCEFSLQGYIIRILN